MCCIRDFVENEYVVHEHILLLFGEEFGVLVGWSEWPAAGRTSDIRVLLEHGAKRRAYPILNSGFYLIEMGQSYVGCFIHGSRKPLGAVITNIREVLFPFPQHMFIDRCPKEAY